MATTQRSGDKRLRREERETTSADVVNMRRRVAHAHLELWEDWVLGCVWGGGEGGEALVHKCT